MGSAAQLVGTVRSFSGMLMRRTALATAALATLAVLGVLFDVLLLPDRSGRPD